MKNNRQWAISALVAAVVLVSGGVLLFAALFTRDSDDRISNNTLGASSDDKTLSQILTNPGSYYGMTVTVHGIIEDVYTERLFAIANQSAREKLLVMNRAPLSEPGNAAFRTLGKTQQAEVIGEVRQFITLDMEEKYAIDFPPEIETAYAGKPVIVAHSFTVSE